MGKGLSLNKERLSMISKYGDINVTQLLYNSNDDNSELEEKFLNDMLKNILKKPYGKAYVFQIIKKKRINASGYKSNFVSSFIKNKFHNSE